MKRLLLIIALLLSFSFTILQAQEIALLKYRGGGDWYANPTALPNLIRFVNENLGGALTKDNAIVEVGSPDLYRYPFIHMTGHGNVVFSEDEAANLRNYLIAGGFLHIDDNYGLKQFIIPQMKLVFPELDFVELPFNHPIFHQKYKFPNGLPKIHEHDNLPPQAFALFWEGRMVCLFTFETDLGDGWEDYEVHKNSEATRTRALQMGANIIQYVFSE